MERNRSDNTHELHRGSKTNLIFAILFVFLVFIDQAGKRAALHFLRDSDIELIPGVLELHYLENKGAAWGMMQNRTWILITVTAIVLIVIACVFYRLSKGNQFRFLRFCLVLLAAGVLGNLIDRIMNHYVIDFIYVSLIDFPVFNFADCFVCISAVLILYCILFRYKDLDVVVQAQEKEETVQHK